MAQFKTITSARKLLSSAEPDVIAVGRAIRDARTDGNFDAFCTSIGMHTRKAYDLITIADAVDDGLLTPRDVAKLGWSKARLVAKRTKTRSQARQAVAFAAANTLPALVAYLRGGGRGVSLVTKSFHLTTSQARQLDAALAVAGVRIDHGRMANRSEALMRIVRAYRPDRTTKPRG